MNANITLVQMKQSSNLLRKISNSSFVDKKINVIKRGDLMNPLFRLCLDSHSKAPKFMSFAKGTY